MIENADAAVAGGILKWLGGFSVALVSVIWGLLKMDITDLKRKIEDKAEKYDITKMVEKIENKAPISEMNRQRDNVEKLFDGQIKLRDAMNNEFTELRKDITVKFDTIVELIHAGSKKTNR